MVVRGAGLLDTPAATLLYSAGYRGLSYQAATAADFEEGRHE